LPRRKSPVVLSSAPVTPVNGSLGHTGSTSPRLFSARASSVPVLEPGAVLASPNSTLRLLVLRGSADGHSLAADGVELVLGTPPPCGWGSRQNEPGTVLVWGACYCDDRSGIEVRCLVPAGQALTVDGREMEICGATGSRRANAVTTTGGGAR
jgi:hypothetical protein